MKKRALSPIIAFAVVLILAVTAQAQQGWTVYGGDPGNTRYSTLTQINPGNVKNLKVAWVLQLGSLRSQESTPLVIGDTLYVTSSHGPKNVFAVEAKTGVVRWRYSPDVPAGIDQYACCDVNNRGVAYSNGRVFVGRLDGALVALDAATGKEVWKTQVVDYTQGSVITSPPTIAKNLVVTGFGGGEYGARGYIVAYDQADGKEVWRFYTVPGPGEAGNETWKGDSWKTGGVSVWITGSYDPQLNLAYWGTGNAAQWMGDQRPGDNLYSASVIALDADTGKLRAHHQYHWNDSWDWDEVSAPILMDVQRGGRTIKSLVHPARNGYLWVLERRADAITFVDAKPYVKQTVFTKLDPRTGRPEYDETKKPVTGKKVGFCPSLWGGKDWPPAAYNPKTGYLYIPANENLCGSLLGAQQPYEPGKLWLGTEIKDIGMAVAAGTNHIGEIQAWNMNTGQKVWTRTFESHNWGPVLTTGSGLVFAGGTNDRYFRAFDGRTGEPVWQWRTNSGITGVPSSFAVDGVQYVAVQSGWGVDAQRMQNSLDDIRGAKTDVPQGGVIWVFAVKQ